MSIFYKKTSSHLFKNLDTCNFIVIHLNEISVEKILIINISFLCFCYYTHHIIVFLCRCLSW